MSSSGVRLGDFSEVHVLIIRREAQGRSKSLLLCLHVSYLSLLLFYKPDRATRQSRHLPQGDSSSCIEQVSHNNKPLLHSSPKGIGFSYRLKDLTPVYLLVKVYIHYSDNKYRLCKIHQLPTVEFNLVKSTCISIYLLACISKVGFITEMNEKHCSYYSIIKVFLGLQCVLHLQSNGTLLTPIASVFLHIHCKVLSIENFQNAATRLQKSGFKRSLNSAREC